MAAPLAPQVIGPLVPSSTHVGVSGVLSGARVRVLVAPGAQEVGSQVAGADGTLMVPLFQTLEVGDLVFAQQERAGQTSQSSNVGVPVVSVPSPLPAVVFASPVTECMNRLLVAGLVPGATVSLRRGGSTLATTVAPTTSAWLDVDPVPLVAGIVLTVTQTVGGATSPPVTSPPLAAVSAREELAPPSIGQPLVACDTAMHVSGVVPGGELSTDFEGQQQRWTNIAASYGATGVVLPRDGKLRARQLLPGCGGESPWAEVPVGPAVTPPAPQSHVFCPEVRRIQVSGLRPSGVLLVSMAEIGSPDVETEIGEIGFSSTAVQVDLPDQVGGQGPQMTIFVRQVRCGLTGPRSGATEVARPGSGALPPPTPVVTEPLYQCMRAVPATGVSIASLVRVVSVDTGEPLSDQMLVSSPTSRIPTWFPLRAGDHVQIEQHGCTAPTTSAVVRVHPLPSPLPTPTIAAPIRPGAVSVTATGCVPSARALLLVNGVERAATEQTWTGSGVFALDRPVVDGDQLFVVQRICTESSDVEGPTVRVTRGRMSLEVTPAKAQGGTSTSVLVTARDADTGADLPGRDVALGGAGVGVTGTAFGWNPPTTGSSATGTVSGGVGYTDAAFSIALGQAVPLNLTLVPGPVVVPGQVVQTGVTWTVTPDWGAPAVTVTGNRPTAMVPPPPDATRRVSVSLSFTAHLAGMIQGISWPQQDIPINGLVGWVALTKSTHALSALFTYGVQSVPVVDESGIVTGWEDRVFALVTLAGVS